MMNRFFDRQGNAIDSIEWGKKAVHPDYKIVNQESIGECFVSTIWIGLDMYYSGNKRLIFETMIFSDDDKIKDCQWRYETEEEAIAGHEKAVQLVKMVKND